MSGRSSRNGRSGQQALAVGEPSQGNGLNVPSIEECPSTVTTVTNPVVAASLHSEAAVTPSEATGETRQVTSMSSAATRQASNLAAPVRTGTPPPSSQVNANVTNLLNANKKKMRMPILNAIKSVKSKPREKAVKRNPKRSARAGRFSHCELCAERDNSRMVQCDGCDKWFHFVCVEVSGSVAEVSWTCPLCPCDEQPQIPVQSVQHEACEDGPPPVRRSSTKSYGTKSSKRSERRQAELKLRRLEEQRKLEQKYLDAKYKILEEMASGGETNDSEQEFEKMSEIADWVRNTERCGEAEDSGVVAEEPVEEPRVLSKPVDEPVVCNQQASKQISSSEQQRGTVREFRPAQRSTPQQSVLCTTSRMQVPPLMSTSAHPAESKNAEETICILNRSQLAARQAVSKDLPEFAGNPEDWPLFFSMFNSSTQMCGFTNEENMLRLRKCLKGKALEAVRCRLLHPSNVSGVLSTLKMLYGRPEAIVQAAIGKIRSSPAPDIERLESLVNFALTVENLVATVDACGVQDFVYNASLKFELVERLPSALKLDWAKHIRGNPAPNLLDFSTWLYSMAEDASAVMPDSTSVTRNRSNKRNAMLNVHVENSSSDTRCTVSKAREFSQQYSRSCFACRGSCSSLEKCKRFSELSYDSKWAVIREVKACRKCLRKHSGQCKRQNKCGVNGCTYLHHPLLHSERYQGQRNSPQGSAVASTSCNIHQARTSDVLFRIAPVLLHGPAGAIHTYAFIDDGSELTLMEHTLAEELGLHGPQNALCLKWTGDTRRVEHESQIVETDISPATNASLKYKLRDVRTIRNLNIRPQTLVASEVQQRYRHLAGIPFTSYIDANPRILIGLDNARLGHALKSREGKQSEPLAIKTRLGWVIYGSRSQISYNENCVNFHAFQACECNTFTDDSFI